MIFCSGELKSAEDVEKNGFKYVKLVIDSGTPYPHVVKCRPTDDYKQYKDKSGLYTLPLYLDAYDARIKKYSPKGVGLSLRSVKA